jgi:hypothetical protein
MKAAGVDPDVVDEDYISNISTPPPSDPTSSSAPAARCAQQLSHWQAA